MPIQHTAFADQLREAIRTSGRSRYRLARQTAISEGQLSRFIHGKVGLSLSSIDRLCQTLGLELKSRDE